MYACLLERSYRASERKTQTQVPTLSLKHAKQLPVTLLKISNPGPSHFVSGHDVAQTGGLGGGGGSRLIVGNSRRSSLFTVSKFFLLPSPTLGLLLVNIPLREGHKRRVWARGREVSGTMPQDLCSV